MAAILTLDDGRLHHCSSFGAQGMLILIAEALPETSTALQRWLADVAERPAPFQDFDLRGLSTANRTAFWHAAAAAYATLEERFGPTFLEQENMFAANSLHGLLALKQGIDDAVPAETVAFDGELINLSELWSEA